MTQHVDEIARINLLRQQRNRAASAGDHAQAMILNDKIRSLKAARKGDVGMSYEAWGDGDDGVGGFTDERVIDFWRGGLQTMREMLARFVEQGGDHATAASIRANWHPDWGKDPGKLDGEIPTDPWGF